MTDLDVWIYLYYHESVYGFSQLAAQALIEQESGVKLYPQTIEHILSVRPSTKHLVHALADKGFGSGFIRSVLNISQPTYSYHLNSTPKRPYMNPYWREHQRTLNAISVTRST